MSFRIAWAGCESREIACLAGVDIVRWNPVAFLATDDMPYCSFGGTAYGDTMTPVSLASTKSHWDAHIANWLKGHGWKSLNEHRSGGMLFFHTLGDHGWAGNDWDHSLTSANDAGSGDPLGATTQAEVDYHWWQGNQCCLTTLWFDNITNTHPLAVAEKPPSADAGTPASNYPPKYFSCGWDVDGVRNDGSPHAEVFLLDDISHRSPKAATDDAGKTMLGSAQKAWFKAKLLASTAVFKIIFPVKKTYASRNAADAPYDNPDIFEQYSTERAELLDFIAANGITGCVWCAGDSHIPVIESKRISDGDTYDHLCVCACPVGNTIKSDYAQVALSKQTRIKKAARSWGGVEVFSTYIEVSLRDSSTGDPWWKGRIEAGSNALSYPAGRFG